MQRVRLTPHYGLMLPVMRDAMPDGPDRAGTGIAPDVAAEAGQALAVARRTALTALQAARPGDPLAEQWGELIKETAAIAAPTIRY